MDLVDKMDSVDDMDRVESVDSVRPAPRPRRPQSPPNPPTPMHILILEDNAADTELMKRELRKAGLDFVAQWVQDKQGFLAALEASAPDLLLADYSLPGFDGLAALTLARRQWEDVPVIIVSGAIGEEVAIEALKAGATDYVLKQRLSRLGPVVHRALDEARDRAEKRRAEKALLKTHEELQIQAEELQAQTEELQIANKALRTQEEQLRESEDRYHHLFEDDLTGNFISTAGGSILLCNPAFAAIFGFSSPQEATGTSIPDLYVDPAERWPLLERLMREGKIDRLETWRRRRDGEPIYVVQTLVGHFNEYGELYEIKGYVFDDTERKRAEDALRREKVISETTIESLPGLFYLFDSQGRFLRWNKGFERISGYAAEEISRMHPLDLFVGEDRRLIERRIQEVFTKGQSSAEAELVSKDGHKTPYFLVHHGIWGKG